MPLIRDRADARKERLGRLIAAEHRLRSHPQSPHAAVLRRIAERELNDEAARQMRGLARLRRGV